VRPDRVGKPLLRPDRTPSRTESRATPSRARFPESATNPRTWAVVVGAARLRLRQDACQSPPQASLHRRIFASCLGETRRALCPPPASAPPLAATCCKTARRRCGMPQPGRCFLSPRRCAGPGSATSSGRSAPTAVPEPRQFRFFDTPLHKFQGTSFPGVHERIQEVTQSRFLAGLDLHRALTRVSRPAGPRRGEGPELWR
jgi:hypothetical protein